MMQGADVVQAIFRTLGIDGWETVGMEPDDVATSAQPWDSGDESLESPERRGFDRDAARDRVGASGEAEMEIALAPCFAEGRAG